jgi:putative membrane protein
MIFLSAFIIKFFKDIFDDKKLIMFLFFGVGIGFSLQELNISSDNISALYIFLCGMLAFSFFLIPGISGSAMLVVLGVYGPIIQAVATLDFNLLFPFALGCFISLLVLPKALLSIYLSHELNLMHIFSGLILSSGIFLL